MFSMLMCDEITITKNADGTYKVIGKMPFTSDDNTYHGTATINRANVSLKIDALADDDKSIMTVSYNQ